MVLGGSTSLASVFSSTKGVRRSTSFAGSDVKSTVCLAPACSSTYAAVPSVPQIFLPQDLCTHSSPAWNIHPLFTQEISIRPSYLGLQTHPLTAPSAPGFQDSVLFLLSTNPEL